MNIQTSRQFFIKLAARRRFRASRVLPVTAALTVACFANHSVRAATYQKANNTTRIQDTASWVEGVVPTTADTALFNSTITGPLSTGNLSANVFSGNFQITDIGGPVTVGVAIAGASTALAINAIDMSAAAADFTFGNVVDGGTVRLNSASGNVSFTVASGRTLTFNSRFQNQGNTKTVTMTGGGNIVFNAAAGSGGATSFSIAGGTNVTLNGAGSFTGANVISGTLNIGNDAPIGAATLNLGGTNANTPTITSVGTHTIPTNLALLATSVGGNPTIAGSGALTVNGVVTNSGASRTLTVNNSALTTLAGGVNLSENATNRTLIVNGSGSTTISGVVANGSTSTTSGLTYAGTGVLSLANTNTYGGVTTVNSGVLSVTASGTLGTGNVLLADTTGVTLTLANATAIADSAILSFGHNSLINLNAAGGSETLFQITDSTNGKTLNATNAPGGQLVYTATDLNNYFGSTGSPINSFVGLNGETVTLFAVPEPSTYAMLALGLGGIGLAATRRRKALVG